MRPISVSQTISELSSDETVHLSNLVAMGNPTSVLAEVNNIVHAMNPACDFASVEKAFRDIVMLYAGTYPGYRKCNTRYHDLNHTTDTFLAMARLMHGAHTHGIYLQKRDIPLGLLSALMHDVGYIQRASETRGTGARFALVHIPRGIAFMRAYMQKNGYSSYDYRKCRAALLCTDLNLEISAISFETRSNACMGKMLAAADLVSQTADRRYLEKLRFLYLEFKEAGIRGYDNELALFEDSLVFNQHMRTRLAKDLDGLDRYLTGHFKTRWGIDKNLYREGIKNNLRYLESFIKEKNKHISRFLKRTECI